MKQIEIQENIYLEKWNLNVTPYLTVRQIEVIVGDICKSRSPLVQQQILVGEVMVACTDILDENEENKELVYEDIVYSGMWNDILESCPYLKQGITLILAEVHSKLSLEGTMVRTMDKISNIVEEFTNNPSTMEKLQSMLILLKDKLKD